MVKRGRSLTCKEILRHPWQWWRIGVFAFLVFGPIWYAIIDREAPFVRVEGGVNPNPAVAGSRVEISWRMKTRRTCRPASNTNLTRRIIDARGVVWDFAGIPSIYGLERPERIARQLDLPRGIAKGTARYKSEACYICDPFTLQRFWPICINEPDLSFEVIAPD